MHGQVEKVENEYIEDNLFVKCDRLGACIWSDEERQIVCDGSGNKKACECPEYLLPTLDKFLSKAIDAKSDIVISNEWLNRKTSETGLVKILDGWDPTVVIYYRRFYDWIISSHYQWHFDFGVEYLETLDGRVRLIDFVRMFCGRLFDSKTDFSPNDRDLGFVDLTDFDTYTYHMWKRYKTVPQYDDKIKIVNFHDTDVVKSFYCDVLNAERACKTQTERLAKDESMKTRAKSTTALIDLAIGLHWRDTNLLTPVNGREESVEPITMKALTDTADKFKERMAAKGMKEEDLPKECLTNSEQARLLNVSLAYEKVLLPESYASGGEEEMRQHFAETLANDKFCSVDIDEVSTNPKWHFLFEEQS